MIKHFLITGDCHGDFTRFKNIDKTKYNPEETAIIILGDAGFNFYLDRRDNNNKNKIEELGFTIYCVRGNHEERPENIPSMTLIKDGEVNSIVFMEEAYPHIRYFVDGLTYNIDGHSALIIGGSYSPDKYYRLNRFNKNAAWTGWFPQEQLSSEEMENIFLTARGNSFDFIFSHTCPLSWQPTDLFLPMVNQSMIDNSMEKWLEKLKNNMAWNVWLFGHYHADRIEGPHIEMHYKTIEELDDIWNRWNNKKTINNEWWLPLGPKFDYIN